MKNYTRKNCTQLGQAEKKNKHAHIASQKNFHAEAGLPTPPPPTPTPLYFSYGPSLSNHDGQRRRWKERRSIKTYRCKSDKEKLIHAH